MKSGSRFGGTREPRRGSRGHLPSKKKIQRSGKRGAVGKSTELRKALSQRGQPLLFPREVVREDDADVPELVHERVEDVEALVRREVVDGARAVPAVPRDERVEVAGEIGLRRAVEDDVEEDRVRRSPGERGARLGEARPRGRTSRRRLSRPRGARTPPRIRARPRRRGRSAPPSPGLLDDRELHGDALRPPPERRARRPRRRPSGGRRPRRRRGRARRRGPGSSRR